MGKTNTKIQLSPHIHYTGQSTNSIPLGKGIYHLYNPSQCPPSSSSSSKPEPQPQPQLQWQIQANTQLKNKYAMITSCRIRGNGDGRVGYGFEGVLDYQGEEGKKGVNDSRGGKENRHAKGDKENKGSNRDIQTNIVNGQGKLVYQGMEWKGKFVDGKLIVGQVNKPGEYTCKGQFIFSRTTPQLPYHTLQSPSQKNHQTYFQLITKQFKTIKLQGTFKRSQLNGHGIYTFQNGDRYEGQFVDGYMEGMGKYVAKGKGNGKEKEKDGLGVNSIEGCFSKSQLHCNGKLGEQKCRVQFFNGDVFQGSVAKGKFHGNQNVYKYQNGTIYQGSFYHHSMTGDCQITYTSNSPVQKYKGQILDGMYNGLGVIQYKNGIILKGYFLKNAKNGPCIIIYGARMWKCLYIMDQLVGEITQIIAKND